MDLEKLTTDLKACIQDQKSDDAISCLQGRPVFIYGAGNYGRLIFSLLVENEVPKQNILGFIDREAGKIKTLHNLPVFGPNDSSVLLETRKVAVVIISIYCTFDELRLIRRDLVRLGYQNIISGYDIAISFHKVNDPRSRILATNFLQRNTDNIIEGLRVWYDSRSAVNYANHFKGYQTGNIENFSIETDHVQYFPKLPVAGKGYSRFIDCGAFTGDTLETLWQQQDKIEELYLFEPGADNLKKLNKTLKANLHSAEKVVLFPCGVWRSIEQLHFDGNGQSASRISDEGGLLIQCVSMDDVLYGVSPTCIKMDIEGAELDALMGAEKIIAEHHPDLAICLYHSLSHFWEIPSFLKRICPGYKFFLRTYGTAGFESVLYARTGKHVKETY